MAHVYVDSNAAGAGTGADWTNAYTTLAAALAAKAAGDQFWVAQDHNATQGSAKTLASPGSQAAPCTVMCVNKAGTVPPVAADLRTTAIEETTGAFAISITTGNTFWYGMILNNSSGATGANLTIAGSGQGHNRFKNCAINQVGTAAGNRIILGAGALDGTYSFDDCTFSFGATGQRFQLLQSLTHIRGGTIGATGSVVTSLFEHGSRGGSALVENVDMTNLISSSAVFPTSVGQINVVVRNCKVGSGFVKIPTTPTRGASLILSNVSNGDVNYEQSKYQFEGNHETSITVKRTGGFSDGTTGLSAKFTTNSGASINWPFRGLPIAAWHDSEGANITVTVEGVGDPRHFSALPTNAEFWLELDYLGTAANTLGVTKSGGPATPLTAGSAYAASTEAWDGGATARANTTAYNLGDVIKLASNAGRIFICTTAGTTAGSEPGGYASAVDGGSVTDNTATFKAAWRFKAVVTTTAAPQNKGPLNVTPVMAKASSVLYLDPKLLVA